MATVGVAHYRENPMRYLNHEKCGHTQNLNADLGRLLTAMPMADIDAAITRCAGRTTDPAERALTTLQLWRAVRTVIRMTTTT